MSIALWKQRSLPKACLSRAGAMPVAEVWIGLSTRTPASNELQTQFIQVYFNFEDDRFQAIVHLDTLWHLTK